MNSKNCWSRAKDGQVIKAGDWVVDGVSVTQHGGACNVQNGGINEQYAGTCEVHDGGRSTQHGGTCEVRSGGRNDDRR